MTNRCMCMASAGAVLILLGGCVGETGELPPPPAEVPAVMASAARAFATNCASCHGEFARGSETGPPLVHPFYVPSHHGDAAFRFAVERGVAAHHWRFGDMPPQPQVQETELEEIIAYVRWLQREAGIE
ncbi:MAG: c-type cytochrome [Gemmatimonadaceae bacterium]